MRMPRVLSLTLIVALLDCPMLCGLLQTVCAEGPAENPVCSCCQHCGAPPTGEEPAPSRPAPSDNSICQCICNGAVIDYATLQFPDIDFDYWSPLPVTTPTITASAGYLTSGRAALWPDDGMNLGRAMRCLFMTYLC